MAITHEGSATGAASAATTIDTITIPAGVQDGDIIVVAATNRGATANPEVTDTGAGGEFVWVRQFSQNADTNGAGSIWYRRAASDSAGKIVTVQGMTNSMACGLSYFRGATDGIPVFQGGIDSGVGEANASGNEVQAGITVNRAGSWVIHCIFPTSNDTLAPGNRTATSPTTITERWEDTSSGGSDCSCSFAAQEKTTAGATGDISWSQTNGTGASIAVVLMVKIAPLTVTSGSLILTPTAITLSKGFKVVADSASFSLTPTTVTLRKTSKIVADSVSFAFTPVDVGLSKGFRLVADSASFVETANTVELTATHRVVVDSADFVFTPVLVGLFKASRIAVDAGLFGPTTFTLAAEDVTLTESGGAPGLHDPQISWQGYWRRRGLTQYKKLNS